MTDNMLAEIEAQRGLGDDLAAIEAEIDATVDSLEEIHTVHLVGSGDSLFAARSVVPFLNTGGGPAVRAHTAFEFVHYVAPEVGPGHLVVPISVSGNSTETVEAAVRADGNEATVVGVTNAADGILAQKFSNSILLGIETRPGWVPGTLTYLGVVATLYYAGVRLSAGTDGGGSDIETLFETLESIGTVVDESKDTAHQVAKNFVHTEPAPPFYILGGGPSRATAAFAAAKFHEIGLPKTLAVGREIEEFAHGEFWALDKNNPVFVVAPEGPGFQRTLDVAEGIREFGNDLVVVTDSPAMADIGKYAFELEFDHHLFSPLLEAIPLQLVVYYYTLELGLDPNDGTHVDPHRKDVADIIHSGKRYE